jgi:hypothetical protein
MPTSTTLVDNLAMTPLTHELTLIDIIETHDEVGLPVAGGPKTTLRRNPISE